MKLTLIDVPEAVDRLEAGERAYEYQTVNNSVRILGPACGFGPASGSSRVDQRRRDQRSDSRRICLISIGK
jgi:hypothetical protein